MAVRSDFVINSQTANSKIEKSDFGFVHPNPTGTFGRIWATDLSKRNPTGLTYNKDSIEDSIENIVMTGLSERVMRPEFGTNLVSYLFKLFNDRALNSLFSEVIGAINNWERRIEINRDDSSLEYIQENHLVRITIAYRIIETQVEATYTTYVSE